MDFSNMNKTPLVFHQIWLGCKPISKVLLSYSRTWLDQHPEWRFELWDDTRSNNLVRERYPHLWIQYEQLPYLTQRVDIIKYLVLFEFGGVYIDFDCECLKPIDDLLTHSITLGLEPRDKALHQEFPFFIGSAFMSAAPHALFFKITIERCQNQLKLLTPHYLKLGMYSYVMETTGPTLVNRVYHDFEDRTEVKLLSPEIIGPFRYREATLYRENKKIGYGSAKLANAYAIHHFVGSWLS